MFVLHFVSAVPCNQSVAQTVCPQSWSSLDWLTTSSSRPSSWVHADEISTSLNNAISLLARSGAPSISRQVSGIFLSNFMKLLLSHTTCNPSLKQTPDNESHSTVFPYEGYVRVLGALGCLGRYISYLIWYILLGILSRAIPSEFLLRMSP